MSWRNTWPNGASARVGKILSTPDYPTPRGCTVNVYLNPDGSWYASHVWCNSHFNVKHPVVPDQIEWLDKEESDD